MGIVLLFGSRIKLKKVKSFIISQKNLHSRFKPRLSTI